MPITRGDVSPLKRHIEESPKLRELRNKRKTRRRRMTVLLLVLFFTIVAGLIVAARHQKMQLTNIVVVGTKVVNSSDVTEHVQKFLDGNYYYVIPHRNALFYPKKKIIADLTQSFPRFNSIAVYRTNLTTLLVTVTEVHGRALWCGMEASVPSINTQCYFTDEAGKIVSEAPYYSGNVYPRFFGGKLEPNDVNPIAKTFTTQDQFENLLKFQEEVSSVDLTVVAIVIGPSGEGSFMVDTGGGKTALVRFLMNDNYDTLFANLTAALGKDALAATLKKDKANLQYFDLRFTNKVYYKFSDQ